MKAFAIGAGIIVASIALGVVLLLVAPQAGPATPGVILLAFAGALVGVEWGMGKW